MDEEEKKEKKAKQDTEAIEKIRKEMQKDQYYLQCQYAIDIVEAKVKIIDEQLSMKHQIDSNYCHGLLVRSGISAHV